jgi:TrmH family RNA methyltransferase
VDAALAAGIVPVHTVVDAERATPQLVRSLIAAGCEVVEAPPDVLAWASSLGHHARVSAIVERSALPVLDPASPAARVGVRLYGVSDPGNVGTILRSADGLGPAHVVLDPRTADPLAPKAVRASMGALFRVPLVSLADAPAARTVALDARAAQAIWDVELPLPVAFELGAERAGLPADVLEAADVRVSIPLAPDGESLNVAMAASIALYDLRRRTGSQ